MLKIIGNFGLHTKKYGFPGRKEQDNGTRLGERKKGRQNKERSIKWKIAEE